MKTTCTIKRLLITLALFITIPILGKAQGNAVELDGNGDYINLGQTTNFLSTSDNFTIELWLKLDWSDNSAKQWVLGNRVGGSGFNLEFSNGDYKIYAKVGGGGNGAISYDMSGKNGFHHIVFTYTAGYPGKSVLYVDGYEVANRILYGSMTYPVSNSNINIGAFYNGAYADYMEGIVDEIRIWDEVIAEDYLRAWMCKTLTSEHPNYSSNLVAYYKANSSSGTTLEDETSNGLDGTLVGNCAFVSSNAPIPFKSVSNGNWRINGATAWNAGWAPEDNWHLVEIYDSIVISDSIGNPDIVTIKSTGELYIDTNVVLNEIVIEPSGELIITETHSLTLNDSFTNTAGTIKIYPNGSFIDDGIINNYGTYIYYRDVPADGWHYMSCPLSSVSSNIFWYGALYTSDETTNSWTPIGANTMLTIPLQGYHVYFKSSNIGSGTRTIEFNSNYGIAGSKFNNGTFQKTLTVSNLSGTSHVNGYNVVGNPYPSFIDLYTLGDYIIKNGLSVESTFYVWDPDFGASGAYTEYKVQGIPGVGAQSVMTTNGATRYLAPTQSFYVRALTNNTTFTITDTSRCNYQNLNTSKFRSKTEPENYISLKVKKGENSDEAIVMLNSNAKDEFDPYFDAEKINASDATAMKLYSKSLEQKNLSINALYNDGNSKSIPLYFAAGENGEQELTLKKDKFGPKYSILLEDKFTNEVIDMRSIISYKFESEVTDAVDRFVIHINKISSVDDIGNTSSIEGANYDNVAVFAEGKSIIINNDSKALLNATIYNLQGKVVYTTTAQIGLSRIDMNNQASGYYLVYLEDREGKKLTEKIFIP
jgi:hypothetical protein